MKTNTDLFFALPLDPRVEARAMLLECVSRVFIWIADAPRRPAIVRGFRSESWVANWIASFVVIFFAPRSSTNDKKRPRRLS